MFKLFSYDMILNYLACRLRLDCIEKFPVLNTALILHIVSNISPYVENQGSV